MWAASMRHTGVSVMQRPPTRTSALGFRLGGTWSVILGPLEYACLLDLS